MPRLARTSPKKWGLAKSDWADTPANWTLALDSVPIHMRPSGVRESGAGHNVAGGISDIAFRAQLLIPEQRQLYDYWVAKSSHGGLPLRRDVSPAHFPKLLPFISLIDVEAGTGRFKVRLAGTRLRDIYDRETTGLYLDDIDWGDKHDYWMASYAHLVKDAKPAQGTIRGPRVQKEHMVQYWLRLPLSVGGDGVGLILCYDAFLSAVEEEQQAVAGNS